MISSFQTSLYSTKTFHLRNQGVTPKCVPTKYSIFLRNQGELTTISITKPCWSQNFDFEHKVDFRTSAYGTRTTPRNQCGAPHLPDNQSRYSIRSNGCQ